MKPFSRYLDSNDEHRMLMVRGASQKRKQPTPTQTAFNQRAAAEMQDHAGNEQEAPNRKIPRSEQGPLRDTTVGLERTLHCAATSSAQTTVGPILL